MWKRESFGNDRNGWREQRTELRTSARVSPRLLYKTLRASWFSLLHLLCCIFLHIVLEGLLAVDMLPLYLVLALVVPAHLVNANPLHKREDCKGLSVDGFCPGDADHQCCVTER